MDLPIDQLAKLARVLLDNGVVTQPHGSKRFAFKDGAPVNTDQMGSYLLSRSDIAQNFTGFDDWPAADKRAAALRLGHELRDYAVEVAKANAKIARQEAADSPKIITIPSPAGDRVIDYGNFSPAQDAQTGELFVFDNRTLRETELYCYTVLERMITMHKGKEDFQVWNTTMITATRVYNGYSLDQFKPLDDGLTELNSYMAPWWRYEVKKQKEAGLRTETPACPPVLDKLIRNVVKDECLDHLYKWIATSILKRNQVYLIMLGDKGIGKTVLINLISALTGHDNVFQVPVGFFESRFDSGLKNARLAVYDEAKLDRKVHRGLKNYVNDYNNLEEKGKNAHKASQNFCSFILASNIIGDLYLEFDDRRFSALDLNSTPLTDVMSHEEITELDSMLKLDSEEGKQLIMDFGEWLLATYEVDDRTPFDVWKGDTFKRIVASSLTEWQKAIIDEFESKPVGYETTYAALKRKNKEIKTFPGKDKVDTFFTNYLPNGVDMPLGEIFIDDDNQQRLKSFIGIEAGTGRGDSISNLLENM